VEETRLGNGEASGYSKRTRRRRRRRRRGTMAIRFEKRCPPSCFLTLEIRVQFAWTSLKTTMTFGDLLVAMLSMPRASIPG
jgi:hypothetical protein